MDVSAQKSLLALLLALTGTEVTLSSTERSALNRVGRLLKRNRDDWQAIQESLNEVIDKNSTYKQVYLNILKQLDTVDINTLLNKLPTQEQLIEELSTDDDLVDLGSFGGKRDHKNNPIQDCFMLVLETSKPDKSAKKITGFNLMKIFLKSKNHEENAIS
jgi:DNA mismatch repair ATPase MutS